MARLKVSFRSVAFLPVALLAATSPAVAQSNDVTLSLGGIPSQARSFRSPSAGSVQISADVTAPPIGLEIGQRAPQFTLVDQFGHEQSNETLKGPKGTIVLFFRSADW